jgi:hypothetical protein
MSDKTVKQGLFRSGGPRVGRMKGEDEVSMNMVEVLYTHE